jgi:hypothetical protein
MDHDLQETFIGKALSRRDHRLVSQVIDYWRRHGIVDPEAERKLRGSIVALPFGLWAPARRALLAVLGSVAALALLLFLRAG